MVDVNEQQLDLRSKNSWMLKLNEVRLLTVQMHDNEYFQLCASTPVGKTYRAAQ